MITKFEKLKEQFRRNKAWVSSHTNSNTIVVIYNYMYLLVDVFDSNLSSEEQPGSPHWGMFKKLQKDSSHKLHKE